jgi:hypothetical protein
MASAVAGFAAFEAQTSYECYSNVAFHRLSTGRKGATKLSTGCPQASGSRLTLGRKEAKI